MIVTVTRQLPANPNAVVSLILPLTAWERTRSRHRFETPTGDIVNVSLPRGTVLHDRALLQSDDGSFLVQVIAKPEPVLTAIAPSPHLLFDEFFMIVCKSLLMLFEHSSGCFFCICFKF